jgi:hypothetical protein
MSRDHHSLLRDVTTHASHSNGPSMYYSKHMSRDIPATAAVWCHCACAEVCLPSRRLETNCVTPFYRCVIQAFTELSPSNAPIHSKTLPLRACPEASVAQQFLHGLNMPHYDHLEDNITRGKFSWKQSCNSALTLVFFCILFDDDFSYNR